MNYPSLFFDSPEIKKSRIIAQKELSVADPFSFYTFRKFSIYLSVALVRRTSITGNQISLFMVMFAFLSAPILLFTNASSFWYPLCYLIIYFLDVVDGEVARLRQQKSKLGKWLDILLWYLLDLFFVVYCSFVFIESTHSQAILYLVLLSILLERFLSYVNFNSEPVDKIYAKTADRSALKTFIKYLFLKEGHFVLSALLITSLPSIISVHLFSIIVIWGIYQLYKVVNTLRLKNE